MIGQMTAPSAPMMLLASPQVQKSTFSDDRRQLISREPPLTDKEAHREPV
jgi:hypothetical protein